MKSFVAIGALLGLVGNSLGYTGEFSSILKYVHPFQVSNDGDVYFLMFTRPGHFFLHHSVALPAVRNWLTKYQMNYMDVIFHMIPHKFM